MKLVLITNTGEQVEAKCAECRHWGTWRRDGKRLRWFKADREQDCNRLSNQEVPGFRTDYDGGLSADVLTGPDWGCANFDPKEPA